MISKKNKTQRKCNCGWLAKNII